MEPRQDTRALTTSLPPTSTPLTLINGINHGVSTDRSALEVPSNHNDGHRGGRGGRGGRTGDCGSRNGPRSCTHFGHGEHTINFCWDLHEKSSGAANQASYQDDNSVVASVPRSALPDTESVTITRKKFNNPTSLVHPVQASNNHSQADSVVQRAKSIRFSGSLGRQDTRALTTSLPPTSTPLTLINGPMTSVKLNGTNYTLWFRSVYVFLQGKGLKKYLVNLKPKENIPRFNNPTSLVHPVQASNNHSQADSVVQRAKSIRFSGSLGRFRPLTASFPLVQHCSTFLFPIYCTLMEPRQDTRALTTSLPPTSTPLTLINGINHGVSTDRSALEVPSNHNDGHRGGRGGRGGRTGDCGSRNGPRSCTHFGHGEHTINFCWDLHEKSSGAANQASYQDDNSVVASVPRSALPDTESVTITRKKYAQFLSQ
ncbi:unnamed protein product [Ilex paraguariensis]|uniref:Retrotransposon Copia-like N-terminal domain-containing protein n=1 Tax=Ilex paraguariensis TaxID=185542 RepID=A0ABC8TD05_9AQUA